MKLLLLVRHAKSSWKDLGKRLAKNYPAPHLVLSSPAVRALSTAKAIAKAIDYPGSHIRVEERLYGADPEEFIQVIRDLDDGADRVLAVGHNPTLTELVTVLSQRPFDNVPTCGVVALRFETDTWDDVGRATGNELTSPVGIIRHASPHREHVLQRSQRREGCRPICQ
jgi:phosphohistidine phosphatase